MISTYEIDATIEQPTASVNRLKKIELPTQSRSKLTPIFNWGKAHTIYFNPSIEICNITFNIRHGKAFVFVESPQWASLKTFGKTSEEAIQLMLKLITNVLEEFVYCSESQLSEDAMEFRRFLIEKILAS